MVKRILISLLLCKISLISVAQLQEDVQIPKIVPPSADAAALGKYGQIPIDKSTGIPQISIPLYTIKTPRFTLPISLSYHASGIRVEEISSWVGAGWTLNAGGLITRTILGMADDCVYGYYTNTIKKAADIQWPGDYLYISNVVSKLLETEPDDFSYNFGSHSGTFVFGGDKNPKLTPYEPIKINFNSSTKNFTAIDEEGNTYYFNTQEFVTSSISTYQSGVSSWYLTKMVSADLTDTINFVYNTDANVQTEFSYNFSQDISYTSLGTWSQGGVNINADWRQYNPVRISSIQFKGGKVDFMAKGGRLDEGNMSLDTVKIFSLDPSTNTYTQLNSYKLLQDYFYSTLSIPQNFFITVSEADKHRLKLTGLQSLDANNAVVNDYQFDYNSTMLPQVHSFAQDKWGYFNGQIMNPTLLETHDEIVSPAAPADPTLITIGFNGQNNLGGDRSLSETNMQAGVLTKITYPTKGYSVLSYECNREYLPETAPTTFSAAAIGMHVENATTNYIPTDGMLGSGGKIFHIKLNKGDGSNVPLPSVSIVRVSDGHVMYSLTADPNAAIDKYAIVDLDVVPYHLVANAQGGTSPTSSNPPFAFIATTCQVPTGSNVTKVGGLRVSSIKDYNSDGTLTNTATYTYGFNEDGGGTQISTIIPIYHYFRAFASAYVLPVCCQGFGVGGFSTLPKETWTNNSIYPLTQYSGSPVAYPQVTIYQGDAGHNNGKSVYNYTVFQDSLEIISTGSFGGIKPIQVSWKNGEPIYEGQYRNDGIDQNTGSIHYSLVKETFNTYNWIGRTGGIGTFIDYVSQPIDFSFKNAFVGDDGQIYTSVTAQGQTGPLLWKPEYFYWYDYPVSTGTRVLAQTITNQYGPDGVSKVQSTTNYHYDNLDHVFPTQIETFTSTGDTRLKKIKYPQDMVNTGNDPTGIYNSMVAANILKPSIEAIDLKNTSQLLKTTTNYALFNGNLIEPQSLQMQFRSNNPETRLQYLSYDSKGNLQSFAKVSDLAMSYIWDYNAAYPIAETKNAAASQIAYTSFEADGTGNWTIGSAQRVLTDAITGSKCYQLSSGNINKSGLTSGNSYIISYWSKNGSNPSNSYSISGGTFSTVQGKTINGWTFYQHIVVATSSTLTISGTGMIDELRLYPKNAQMTTYTYTPLVGITSQCDVNNRIIYNEYDSFNRLKLIRDQDKNILKTIDYKYQATPNQ